MVLSNDNLYSLLAGMLCLPVKSINFFFYIKHSLFSCFIGLRKPTNPYAWNGLLQLPLSHFWVLVVVYITTLSKVLLLINNRLSWLWSLTFLTLEQSFLSATWSVYRMSDVLLWKATQCTDVFWWHSQSVLFVFQWIASFSIKKQNLSLGGATCFKDAGNNLWLFREHLEKCSKIGCYDIIVKVRYTVNIFLFTHSESSMFLLCHIYTETHSTLEKGTNGFLYN